MKYHFIKFYLSITQFDFLANKEKLTTTTVLYGGFFLQKNKDISFILDQTRVKKVPSSIKHYTLYWRFIKLCLLSFLTNFYRLQSLLTNFYSLQSLFNQLLSSTVPFNQVLFQMNWISVSPENLCSIL